MTVPNGLKLYEQETKDNFKDVLVVSFTKTVFHNKVFYIGFTISTIENKELKD